MEVEKEVLPPDDLRCKRSDGRGWRCKKFALEGKTLCDNHLQRAFNQKKKRRIKYNDGFTPVTNPETGVNDGSTPVSFPESGVNDGFTPVSVPESGDNDGSTPVSVPKSTPRVKIRFRVKPEVEAESGDNDGSTPVDMSFVLLALPAFNKVSRDERVEIDLNKMPVVAEGGMRGPRTKRPMVVDDVEEGERRGPRVKRVNVIGDVEERENGNGNGNGEVVGLVRAEVGAMRGPRTKRVNVEESVEVGLVRADVAGMRGPRTKRPNVVGDVEVGLVRADVAENGSAVEEVGLGVVRCRRSSGRGWRCGREAKEGHTMCDVHLSRGKVKSKENGNGNVNGVVVEMVEGGGGGEIVVKEEVESEVEEEEEIGNQLAMVADLAVLEAERREGGEGKDVDEEDWRCKRTDGRKWRCKRRVSEGKTLCDLHFEQGRLRQNKRPVPGSLKIQKGEGGEGTSKRSKRKREVGSVEDSLGDGKKKKADLIRGFLRREIIDGKKNKGALNKCNSGEITKDLPFGLMAIPSQQILENVGSFQTRVGVDSDNSLANRRFRSKNVEPSPVGATKVVPFAGNAGKVKGGGRRKCHWCKNSDKLSLTKCLSCKKRFFCASCIKDRETDPEEVKVKCPVCRGNCNCKTCGLSRAKDTSTKEILKGAFQGSKSQQLQYLIKFLLPILEQLNQEQTVETETAAKSQGQDLSEVEIRQADIGYKDQCCCNNCKSPILDFHRSCSNCSYNLCLSCCREYSQGGSLKGTENAISGPHNIMKTCLPGLRICSEKILTSASPHSTGCADLGSCLQISCPPVELGGCDNSLLDLRCIFPLNWTKELEISAKETDSGLEFPHASDSSVHCSLCASTILADDKNKEIQEASRRKQSNDNFLYCPSFSDDHHNMLAHFQTHWRKGHPVNVRNIPQSSSASGWDPLAMVCNCLEINSSNCVNKKDATETVNCIDWYELEIGSRDSFCQSLEEGCINRRHKTLRMMVKLSSSFSRRVLEDHYSEIIQALPLQEYTNPRSGLLNIAGKLPEGFPESKLGPHVCISFGSRDVVAQGELVTKLHYNSYDMVNILAHVADVTCSAEQLNKISMLLRHNNMKDKVDQSSGYVRGQNGFLEGSALSNGIVGTSCSPPINEISAVDLQNDRPSAEILNSVADSDSSIICSGTSDSPNKPTTDHTSHVELLESSSLGDKRPSDPCGAQWDVFRREDVPKLMEYIAKHVEDLSFSCDFRKNLVHPIFDGSFYLDSIHKMKMKEEFDIEPWTFNQRLGEAVFIPAGCPYQTRYIKSCVNITLGFVSPENASECIKLINEIRTLPNNHKAKEVKLEVEKMAICSIDEAIREVYRLRSEESIHLDKGVQIPNLNS